ncbi:hypothetical protein [Streptomyces torulosus]|uniref:hypothetical protein n=1 Tax=Streptomyces torulosus TaxID=68276 RepID=UPI0006EB5935|nr:hypothetical protein [Streptomyces torulosus]
MSHDHVVAGIAAALRAGALASDAVALEARLAAERETSGEPGSDTALGRIASPVVSLTARRLAESFSSWTRTFTDPRLCAATVSDVDMPSTGFQDAGVSGGPQPIPDGPQV